MDGRFIKPVYDGEMAIGGSQLGYSGQDSDCVYLSSRVELKVAGESDWILVGSCFTLVGTRHMVVHSYGFEDSGVTFGTLKARSRSVAASAKKK